MQRTNPFDKNEIIEGEGSDIIKSSFEMLEEIRELFHDLEKKVIINN